MRRAGRCEWMLPGPNASPVLSRRPGIGLTPMLALMALGVLLGVAAAVVALTGDQPHELALAERQALTVITPIAVGLYAWREGTHARFGRLLVLAGGAWFRRRAVELERRAALQHRARRGLDGRSGFDLPDLELPVRAAHGDRRPPAGAGHRPAGGDLLPSHRPGRRELPLDHSVRHLLGRLPAERPPPAGERAGVVGRRADPAPRAARLVAVHRRRGAFGLSHPSGHAPDAPDAAAGARGRDGPDADDRRGVRPAPRRRRRLRALRRDNGHRARAPGHVRRLLRRPRRLADLHRRLPARPRARAPQRERRHGAS